MHTLPTPDAELATWLRLSMAPGLRPAALRALLGTFGLPEAILAQPFSALAAASDAVAAHAALSEPGAEFARLLEATLAWREASGNQIVTLADPAYPPSLLTMPDPPSLLYVQGRLELLHTKGVAVVGSRSASPQGFEDAARFASALSEAGLVVISGLALGIDGAAHRAALRARGGTLAVIGTGADLVYPAAHLSLAREIGTAGAIVSEWPLGTPARAAHFPQRNRLIAAFSSGVLIIEAAMRSGSLITARLANEMGRDIFALPGSIHAPLSRGCHRLIKQGAKLVETPEEVLDELGLPSPGGQPASTARAQRVLDLNLNLDSPARGPALQEPARRLLLAIGYAPATLEILAARTEMESTTLQSALLQLELAGHLAVLPGGRYARVGRG